MKLKPINSFESRSGIKPIFDTGDIITNGDDILLVLNITSSQTFTSTGNTSSVEYIVYGISRLLDYHKTNKEYTLIKKGDKKLQLFISNEFALPDNIIDISLGVASYPSWFENKYTKLVK